MKRKQYTKRQAVDFVNGAILVERVNGRLWKMRCSCGEVFIAQPSDSKGVCRKCAMEKHFATCAECSKMNVCDELSAIISNNKEARDNLQSM